MVFFNNSCLPAAHNSEDDSSEEECPSPSCNVEATVSPPSGPCSSSQAQHSQLVVDVRRRTGGGVSSLLDISVSHSISQPPHNAELSRRSPTSGTIPVRSVTSLCSLFDLAGTSGCTSTYVHGRELGGKSSVIALQVPASSLPPPMSAAAAMVDSFQMSSSSAFFPHYSSSDQRLDDARPSIRQSMPCVPCETSQNPSVPTPARVHGNHDRNAGAHMQTPQSSHAYIIRRLSEVLQGRSVEDLVLQPSERDNTISQFLQALDVHVVGACRADERLRPMLRWNASCSGADGRLLEHLSQHFKARELAMLARCLCAPLVTIRVGKVQRQGRLLCPTSTRGYLSLSMLPYSEMRLSFIEDSGVVERIAAAKSSVETACIGLEIPHQDPSGRSFVLKLPGGGHAYFWQSEKSKNVGDEKLSEMKDLLTRRPTLSQLTGVHESRLDSFVTQLRTVSTSSTSLCFPYSSSISSASVGPANINEMGTASSPSPVVRQSQRLCGSRSLVRLANNQPCIHGRVHGGTQGSLSPRASGFKEGAFRGMTSARSLVSSREKHRRRTDGSNSASPSSVSSAQWNSNVPSSSDAVHGSSQTFPSLHISICSSSEERIELSEAVTERNTLHHPASTGLDPCGFVMNGLPLPKQMFSVPLVASTLPMSQGLFPSLLGGPAYNLNASHPPLSFPRPVSTPSILAPYSCPCPLRSSTLQYAVTPPVLPPMNEMCALPSSSPFYSVKPSSAFLSQTTISLDRVSISPIPLPMSSIVNIPTPLQTSSLPSFFSDPIVHIPVIDFQSANQSFIVSAPPTIASSGNTPVLPSFLSGILSSTEQLMNDQDLPTLNIFGASGTSSILTDKELGKDSNDMQPYLIDSRFRALLSSCTGEGVRKNREGESSSSWCQQLEGSQASVFDSSQHFTGPLLGMVPALITTGSLSCVVNYRQDGSANAAAWISGSRGLYGRSCEPGLPISTAGMCCSFNDASVNIVGVCPSSKGKSVSADVDDCQSDNSEGYSGGTESGDDLNT